MFISMAHASVEVGSEIAGAPSVADAFWTNMGLIGLMFVLFYMLMIRPQQNRLKSQRAMLDDLKKGDKVVTGAGFVGTVSKVVSDAEVEIDLGSTKVVALRYTIQTKMDDDASLTKPEAVKEEKEKPAKKSPAKKAPAKKNDAKKPAAKKAPTKKKTPAKKKDA